MMNRLAILLLLLSAPSYAGQTIEVSAYTTACNNLLSGEALKESLAKVEKILNYQSSWIAVEQCLLIGSDLEPKFISADPDRVTHSRFGDGVACSLETDIARISRYECN